MRLFSSQTCSYAELSLKRSTELLGSRLLTFHRALSLRHICSLLPLVSFRPPNSRISIANLPSSSIFEAYLFTSSFSFFSTAKFSIGKSLELLICATLVARSCLLFASFIIDSVVRDISLRRCSNSLEFDLPLIFALETSLVCFIERDNNYHSRSGQNTLCIVNRRFQQIETNWSFETAFFGKVHLSYSLGKTHS